MEQANAELRFTDAQHAPDTKKGDMVVAWDFR